VPGWCIPPCFNCHGTAFGGEGELNDDGATLGVDAVGRESVIALTEREIVDIFSVVRDDVLDSPEMRTTVVVSSAKSEE
jgi:hypothetical protein